MVKSRAVLGYRKDSWASWTIYPWFFLRDRRFTGYLSYLMERSLSFPAALTM